MKRGYLIGGIATAAVLVGGGFGVDAAVAHGGGPAGSSYGAGATYGTGMTSAVALGTAALQPGTALVDGAGRTLYLFEADSPTMSACSSTCAQVWPPLLTHGSPVTVSGGAHSGLVGSVARSDGTRQVAYDGHPLYYYAGDRKSGDSHGQGLDQFGASWYVVAPGGNKIDPNG
jgi:predicted lipoprotein with Yx(FWY)xxD motif